MGLIVRTVNVSELGLIVYYFHQSTPKHLEMLGVDPARLPRPEAWRKRFEQ